MVSTDLRPYADVVERVMNAMDQMTSGIGDPESWLIDAMQGGSGKTKSGVYVNEYSAMGLPSVWYAVNKIAGHVATMPLELRRKTKPNGSVTLPTDPRQRVMNKPNLYQTSVVFREQLQGHTLLCGNARAYIDRNTAKQPIDLIPLLPEATTTVLINGEKWHQYFSQQGQYYNDQWQGGHEYWFRDEDVLHIPGFGWNGVWGYSLVDVAKEALGLGLAGQNAAAYTFVNGGKPGIILEAPIGKFRDPAKAKQLVESFDRKQTGIDNAGKTALLREGVTAKTLPISASDSQFLEQRSFQREDTALLFLLETIIGDNSGAVYKSITERNSAYLVNCLSRWLVKWEQECKEKLLTEAEKEADELFWKFDTRQLLSGDPNSLADYTSKMRQQGSMSGNEVRAMHGMNMIDDPVLNTYLNPMTTAGDVMMGEGDDREDDYEEQTKELPSNRAIKVARNAIRSRMTTIINAEINRVQAVAGNKPNFTEWLSDFYDRQQTTMEDVIDALGGDPLLAEQHCTNSKQALNEIASVVSIDQLADNVASCVAQWGKRIENLTEAILDGAMSND